MNEQWISRLKKWGSLAIVFIVIVCISGALPRYLTPPAAQPQQTVKKNSTKTSTPTTKIDHLAIVNEDQGATLGGQRLNLGNQVVPLFSNGDDYQWETVSRSVADNGLKQGDYQAVFYIPSNFTTNIFTYTNSNPKAAVISYQANPKLTAEDTAKIQTEMQKVKGTLNQQFSKIYWRIISDKLSYIRGNFSDVVNKDKQYLQAMSDFYKPSSKNMAQVFDAQLNQINELLGETKQTAGDLSDRQSTLTDTKTRVSQQLDALNKLSDQMNQQIQALEKTRDANKQLVDDATTQSQANLTKVVNTFNNGMVDPLSTAVTIENPLDTGNELTGLNHLIDGANTSLSTINSKSTDQLGGISNAYTDHLITPVDELITKINISKDNLNAVINPDNASDSNNIFGQVNTLNKSAQDLFTQANSYYDQAHDLYDESYGFFGQNNNLYDQLYGYYHQADTFYEQAHTLYDQAYGIYGQTDNLFDQLYGYYNQANSFYDQVYTRYDQGKTLYNQAQTLYSQEQDIYNQNQTLYKMANDNAINNVKDDIENLKESTKPTPLSSTTKWDGEQDVLKSIGKTQNDIGGSSGLANNEEIKSISELTPYLDNIDNDTEYENPSLFINPSEANNYDETTLKVYQEMLNHTFNSLNKLLNFVTNRPKELTEPIDPGLAEPTDPKLTKPLDPKLTKPTIDPKFTKPTDPGLTKPADPELTEPNKPTDPTQSIYDALNTNVKWVDQATGQLTSSVTSLGTIQTTAQPVNQTETLTNTQRSIQDQYNSAIKRYNDALTNQKTELGKVENTLTSNMNDVQQQVASIAKPLVVTEPDPTFDNVDNGFALSFKSNTFDQLNTIDEALQNISDNESLILKDSQNVQSLVNDVQGGANQLTGSWGQNLNATAELGSTISQTLGNTGEPGNRNQNAYQQLASPVNLAGVQVGNANNQTQNQDQSTTSNDTTPTTPVTQPFLTLLAVLIASILTGFFSYHYRNLSVTANALISILLGLVTSSAVIYYGISQYGLDGTAAIMWSIFTVGLIAVMSAWIREAYQLSEIVGVLILTAMIVIFTLPLLRNSLDRFAFQNPAADVYMAIAYGPDYLPFYKGLMAIVGLFVPVFAVIGIRAIIQHVREEKAHETEIM
ncbi:type VII secretion protein EsaA [Sporolactobacillus laevolacticus]|uniref:Type VII secretion system accessory factor EsaA n=1 Tax=Sporolactobacillus laevolacticus DSM 442 TaxID=1395513 RepID=V6J018_9BACL|nr:type VII secretion protein EsaA [Sporolactobacillus laevolacticus]EST12486.1 hypothetical protein P343_07005 [Sporolactobacillus laevolacticus DSM 442]